jgi:tetratricopeptide (TPR) repeat protein
MGLFARKKKIKFVPNFKKPDYDNLLDFIDCGGSSKEWERLKKENQWVFPESEAEKFMRYQKEVKQVSQTYYAQMNRIQEDWSTLYNLSVYTGFFGERFEKLCLANIANYKEMLRIDKKYGKKTATNIPAFKRLAMLYEKQGRFEEAVEVCKQAYSLGMDERSRMVRMIKKAGRKPTQEEQSIIDEEIK